MKTSLCKICNQIKNETEFHKAPKKKNGLDSRCRACRKILEHELYLKRKASPTLDGNRQFWNEICSSSDDQIERIISKYNVV